MKILVAGLFGTPRHEDAWCRALRELGHEVGEFRMLPYLRLGSLWNRVQNRYLFGPLLWKVNHDLLAFARSFRPDVFVGYRALLIYPRTILRIRKETGAFMACYQNDNIFGALRKRAYWRLFREAIPLYDGHFVFRHSDIPRYRECGARHAVLLRHQYLPWLHRRLSPESVTGWKSDICFIGHCEPDSRVDYMDVLMRRVPANYRLHGYTWREHAKGRAWDGMETPDVLEDDYVAALNGAKIALAFLSTWNEDTYTTRHFEIPACGTLMVSQRTEDLLTLYEEDKEAVFFSTSEELADKARYYLAHESIRRRIADAGWKRCTTSGYDIFSRMKEFLTVIEGMTRQTTG